MTDSAGPAGAGSRGAVRVGLTGGVAAGKSTVAALLADLGAVVLDADQVARDVVAAGTPGLAAVVREFGDVLTPDGALDRPALAATVFADPAARRRLEAIVHPLVIAELGRREASVVPPAAQDRQVVVHDLPLLVEMGRAHDFDAVVVVDVPEHVQRERMTTQRGWAAEEIEGRLAAQTSREDRLRVATHVIDNTGTPQDLLHRVAEVYAELSRLTAGGVRRPGRDR